MPGAQTDVVDAKRVAFISIIRVIFLDDLHRSLDPDFTWIGARFAYLSLIELNAGIVVSSVLTMKPLANRFFPAWFAVPTAGAHLTQGSPPTIGTRAVVRGTGWMDSRAEADDASRIAAWEDQMEKGGVVDSTTSSSS
jgi:hypothetical protein